MAVNIYKIVTDRIIEQMKKGIIPWHKSWKSSGGAINYVTRKPYRGINIMLLDRDGEWLTFKQCKDCGGKIKKGEKSSVIVFYKLLERENEETGEKETAHFLQYSNVFHISQCEGIESKLTTETNSDEEQPEPIEMAETVIRSYVEKTGVKFDNDFLSSGAYYKPYSDTVVMPKLKEQFESAEEYYSTAFHELAHSTGHKTRLDRFKAHQSRKEYAREELIAEISSAMIMNKIGIEQDSTFKNSVAYLQSWIKVLSNDYQAIVKASQGAEKAVEYILN